MDRSLCQWSYLLLHHFILRLFLPCLFLFILLLLQGRIKEEQEEKQEEGEVEGEEETEETLIGRST